MKAAAAFFIQNNPGLIGHLSHTYRNIERDEIVSTIFVAAAEAGTRNGATLTKYICNRVQRQARLGTAAVVYTLDAPPQFKHDYNHHNGEQQENDNEWDEPCEQSLVNCDPLDILVAKETARDVEARCGAVWNADLEGYDNPDGITDRGMRKRRARTAAERAKIAAMRDTFGGWL